MSTQGEIQTEQYGHVIRSMIQHENELINHRLTWLTTVQGLLFASLGFAWDKPTSGALISLLCSLGVAVSVAALVALTGASLATANLCLWWDTHKPKDYKGPDVIGGRPSGGRRIQVISRYVGPWSYFPVLFIITWALVWIIR